jgi:hypothetical protein
MNFEVRGGRSRAIAAVIVTRSGEGGLSRASCFFTGHSSFVAVFIHALNRFDEGGRRPKFHVRGWRRFAT